MDPRYDRIFEGHAWESLHDTMLAADNKVRTKEEVREAFEALPDLIKGEALHWGVNDTVVREAVYRHLTQKG